MEVSNATVLVTGAGSGLGAACVSLLRERGARVVAGDIREEALSAAHGEGPDVQLTQLDVTDPASVSAALANLPAGWQPLRAVIQCAGILAASRIVGRQGPHDLELFRRVIDVNLIGTFNVMRLATSAMQANAPDPQGERGVVINTASIAAWEGQLGQAAYAASKGGVAAMTLPAARELARWGIRVVAIAPGVFGTPMMGATDTALQDQLRDQIPFPARFGHPREFAELAAHILQNPMLNGSVHRIDGAMRMR